MSRLWSCGFELQSATGGIEWDTSTGTMSISTSTKRSGAAALRCNPSAATGFLAHRVQADTINRLFFRTYLYIATAPSVTTDILAYSDGSAVYPKVQLTNSRTLILHDGTNPIGSASAALTVGVWYRVELDYDDATDAATLYLNGASVASGTAQDMGGGGIIRIGVQTTCTADLYFDDVAANSTAGSAQTGLPGAGGIVHLRPDAAGDNAGFATTVGGSSNWGRVSETTPDDATTYNATTATGTTTIDDFNCGTPAAAGIGANDLITLVQVGARIGSTAATAASIVTRVKSQASGTVAESGSTSVALNGWSTHAAATPKIYGLTSYTDPQAGGPWTTALLDTMQIGYRGNVSQSTTRRVSTLWALVEYTAGGSAALGAATALTTAGQIATTGAAALSAATSLTAAGLLFGDPHPSSPPLASANSGNTVTSTSFTPDTTAGPVVLVAIGWHDTASGNSTNSSDITDSRGLTWTKRRTRSKGDDGGAAQNGHVQMSWAVVPQGTPTAMTVTTTGTNTGGACSLQVYVHPDVDPTTPIGADAENSSTGLASVVVVTAHNGERVYVALSDWNVAANPTAGSGQTALISQGIGTGPDMRIYVGVQNAVTPASGTSVTMSTASPTSGSTNNVIAWSLNPKTTGLAAAADLASATGLTAAGIVDTAAAAALAAATAMAVVATQTAQATAALDAATALTAAATPERLAAAALNSATVLTTAGGVTAVAAAQLSAATALTAAATLEAQAAANLSAATALTSIGDATAVAAVALGASTSVAGAAVASAVASAALTSATALTASGTATIGAAIGLTATTALDPAATQIRFGAAALTSAATLAASALTGNDSSATLAASADLTAAGVVTGHGSTDLTAATAFAAAATPDRPGTANLSATSSLAADGTAGRVAGAALTAASALASTATAERSAAVVLTASATFTADATSAGGAAATLGSVTTLTTAGVAQLAAIVNLAAGAVLAAAASSSGLVVPARYARPGSNRAHVSTGAARPHARAGATRPHIRTGTDP